MIILLSFALNDPELIPGRDPFQKCLLLFSSISETADAESIVSNNSHKGDKNTSKGSGSCFFHH
ncbi:hypothetical protein [Rufibacter sp. LB8]|uniref:hypothetical protein n=1 Tax=Rufibacter sp. LB8 TaxID=2777781 RepID=UPI00178C2C3E|nr:hypothetical protein [Rufibacter sp. LB8]